MTELLRCNDYFGRLVVLTESRWNEHILIDHAEMASLQGVIEDTLVDPDLVNYDRDFADREVFYKLEAGGTSGNRHIKVCVEYRRRSPSSKPEGRIITAYITRNVKRGEATKWRRET